MVAKDDLRDPAVAARIEAELDSAGTDADRLHEIGEALLEVATEDGMDDHIQDLAWRLTVHPKLSAKTLPIIETFTNAGLQFDYYLAAHPAQSVERWQKYIEEGDWIELRGAMLSRHVATNVKAVEQFLKPETADIAAALAMNPHAPPELLERLAEDPEVGRVARDELRRNPSSTPAVVIWAAAGEDATFAEVKAAVADWSDDAVEVAAALCKEGWKGTFDELAAAANI